MRSPFTRVEQVRLGQIVVVVLVLMAGISGGAEPIEISDGDRLPDSWERCERAPGGVELPGADPDRMSLYVQVSYAEGIEPLTDEELRAIEANWAEMPVRNPDGSTGIDIHIDDEPPYGGPLEKEIVISGDVAELREEGRELRREYFTEEHMGERLGIYHHVVLVEMDSETVAGLGNTPGMFALVDGTQTHAYRNASGTSRTRLITHELLHNVVGPLDPELRAPGSHSHTETGWLSSGARPLGEHEYLPEGVARQIERDGFADFPGHARLRPSQPVSCSPT